MSGRIFFSIQSRKLEIFVLGKNIGQPKNQKKLIKQLRCKYVYIYIIGICLKIPVLYRKLNVSEWPMFE